MKLVAIVSLALLFVGVPAKLHPVASVIKLLDELQSKVDKEAKTELATWLKFKKWCTDSGAKLTAAVKSDKESIDELNDFTAAKEAEQTALSNHIDHLSEEIAQFQVDDAAAKKSRNDANKLYKAADKDFASTIDAVDKAFAALKASKKASMLQFLKPENPSQEHALRELIQQPLVLEQLSDEQRDALSSAVFGPVTDADILAKEKYAKSGKTYTFKSNDVIKLLSNLKTHFQDARTQATKAETNAANEYEVAKQARDDALSASKKTKATKTSLLAEVSKDLATGNGYLKQEKGELKDDSQTQKDTAMTCRLKEEDYNARNDVRTHEMEAMKAAEEVLSKVTGVRTSAPKTETLPTTPKLLLLQISHSDPKMEAVNLIRKNAIETHSKQLLRFADRLAARLDGNFDVANEMVQKMIFRLMAEQKSEDEHKHWCDLEISTSKTSQKDKSDKVRSLDAKIKDAKAASAELGLKIEELNEKESDLLEYMKEATEVRKEGKEENRLALEDSEAAQAAIAKAEAVLEAFYKDSGMIEKESWEFLQVPAKPDGKVVLPKNPKSWTKSYTGTVNPNDPKTGVIAVLKATAADFAKMEADTKNQEHSDQKQFEKDMKSATIDKAQTVKESEMKSDEQKRTDDKVRSLERKRKHVASEESAVTQYLKDLEGGCVNADSSYEDRKKARDSEIGALRKSQVTLQNAFAATSLLQKIQKHA